MKSGIKIGICGILWAAFVVVLLYAEHRTWATGGGTTDCSAAGGSSGSTPTCCTDPMPDCWKCENDTPVVDDTNLPSEVCKTCSNGAVADKPDGTAVPGEPCKTCEAGSDVPISFKLVISGSSPEDEGPYYFSFDGSTSVEAKPTLTGASFGTGKPTWSYTSKPAGSNLSAPSSGSTASVNPDVPGTYVLSATCGSQSDSITLHAVKIEILTRRSGASQWDTSGTSIAAGGISSAVHRADVEIQVTPDVSSAHQMTVKLTGDGGGYDPDALSQWWWSSSAIKAKSTVGGSTVEHGSSGVEVDANTTSGTLTSSNKVESTTIEASIDSIGVSDSKSVSFVVGEITFDGGGTPTFNQWHPVSITRKLDSTGIDGHSIAVVVKNVTIKEIDGTTTFLEAEATSSTSYTSLSEYVELESGGAYANLTTGAGLPSATMDIKVVDPRVVSYQLGAGDMSVAQ